MTRLTIVHMYFTGNKTYIYGLFIIIELLSRKTFVMMPEKSIVNYFMFLIKSEAAKITR